MDDLTSVFFDLDKMPTLNLFQEWQGGCAVHFTHTHNYGVVPPTLEPQGAGGGVLPSRGKFLIAVMISKDELVQLLETS